MSQGPTNKFKQAVDVSQPSAPRAAPSATGEERLVVDRVYVTRFLVFLLLLGGVLGAALLVYQALLIPLGVSAFLTYALLPLVERIQRRGVRRTVAVGGVVFGIIALMSFAVFRVAPQLYWQAWQLIKLIPGAVNTASQIWLPIVEKFVVDLDILEAGDVHRWFTVGTLLGKVESQLQAGLTGLWVTGASLLGGVVNIALIPIFTFFLLLDWPHIAKAMRGLVPRDLLRAVDFLAQRVDLTLRSVIKGQMIVAAILAVLYVIGLSIIGLKAAVVIGLIAGLCRIIPYLDVIVGGALSLIVVLSDFHSMSQIVAIAAVFLVVQAIDGMLITPRVIGERVGLHPAVVILSVLAFADWLGFWGVLIAIPVVAIAKALLFAAKPYYLASRLYDRQNSAVPVQNQGEAGGLVTESVPSKAGISD